MASAREIAPERNGQKQNDMFRARIDIIKSVHEHG